MKKIKFLASASIMSAMLLSTVAFAATPAMAGTNDGTKEKTPAVHAAKPKLTADQKACVATAKTTKSDAIKAASATLAQALKDAKAMTDATAKKAAKAAARKAYKDAVASAMGSYKTAYASCVAPKA